jgi:preprotein translocase subunit SecD
MKSNDIAKLVFIILIVALSVIVAFMPTAFIRETMIVDQNNNAKSVTGPMFPYRLGLDLRGGVHVVLEANKAEGDAEFDQKMERTIAVLENRVNRLGVSETIIQRQGVNRIAVDLPGYQNKDEALTILGKTALLQFKDAKGNLIFDGSMIKDAQARFDTAGSGIGQEWHIVMTMQDAARAKFKEATKRASAETDEKNRVIGIWLDETQLMAPTVKEEIDSETVSITSGMSDSSSKQTWAVQNAALIAGGALPLKLNSDPAELRVVGASLGQDTVNSMEIAAVLALIMIGLYITLYYKGMGLLSVLTLSIYAVIYLALLLTVGAVFSLPAIGAAIISVGMAVDSNVIVFERIRDELGMGKTKVSAVANGFSKAIITILDSNLVTLIGCGILYWQGTGAVKGFALTLAFGIFTSFFTTIFVTKFIMDMITKFWKVEPGSSAYRFFYGSGGGR